MAELFIELFSEEIPAKLQTNARQQIKQALEEKLSKKEISFKSSKSFSTPTRLVFNIDGIPEKIKQSKKTIFPKKTYIDYLISGCLIKLGKRNEAIYFFEKGRRKRKRLEYI